jgi:hypothetical protein
MMVIRMKEIRMSSSGSDVHTKGPEALEKKAENKESWGAPRVRKLGTNRGTTGKAAYHTELPSTGGPS